MEALHNRNQCSIGNKGCAGGVYLCRLETRMRVLRVVIVTLLSLLATLAFCCSCSYGPPIQKTYPRGRAVFRARIVEPIGNVYNWDGKRLSDRVLAIVHERYWGLPWYWPKVVILDGSYPCDTAMAIGEEYLVSGARGRYGVLAVNGCSRTFPLTYAKVDLRTLDGSRCGAPGGTLIGYVRKGNDEFRDNPPAPNVSVTLRDQDGKTYLAQTDGDGIYELRHLTAGVYTVESPVSANRYASGGTVAVVEGICIERTILLKDYSVRGRLLPGLNATVELVGVDDPMKRVRTDGPEADGNFYFRDVPDGEYLLSVRTWIGAPGDLYYPGTFDRGKATRLRITDHLLARGGSLDFNPTTLPFVPIPVTLNPPDDSAYHWRILLSANGVLAENRWVAGQKVALLYGMRGASYGLGLYGDSEHPLEYGGCRSVITPIVANPGMATIHLAVPPKCQQ